MANPRIPYGEAPPQGRAETLKEVLRKGETVWYRWVSDYSYPRNGNVSNPTPKYTFERWENGVLVDSSYLLRNLKY
jgi:hypothetical protein